MSIDPIKITKKVEFLLPNGKTRTYSNICYYDDNNNLTFKEWRYRGKLYSPPDGSPALEYIRSKLWYYKGMLHRENAPAVILNDGTQTWYKFGLIHRDDGPAHENINYENYQQWYENGKRHRRDGPAVINGNIREWWWNNKSYNFNKWAKYANLSDRDKAEILMQY